MRINWKVRLRNRVFLTSLIATVLTFVFDLLALLDVTPAFSQDMLMQFLSTLLTLLTALGVVIDPTTAGAADSERAMSYK